MILAAGKSTRMQSDVPKVLHEVCGRPMLAYVLDEVRAAGAGRLIVVVGHGRQAVIGRFAGQADVTWVEQAEQRGTGHAALGCREALRGFAGNVMVIAGDMPLVRRETIAALIRTRIEGDDAVSIATTELDDPTGYGRIVRDGAGELMGIVEHRDCKPQQLAIREVNPSYYCFSAERLFEALDQVRPSPPKGEVYLTEAIRVLRESGHSVSAKVRVAAEDAMGVNSRQDLAEVSRAMQKRLQSRHMDAGVTFVSPENTWIEADVDIGRDTTIYPFTFIASGARVGQRCRIGPFAHIGRNDVIRDESVVSAQGMEAKP